MVPFRDVSYKIPTKKYLEYANNPDQAVKQFVKDYHLNPNKPERMNVLNTNRRDNRVQLFDFDEDFICRWQTKDKSKVLELLCDRGVNALFFAKTMLAAAGIKLDPKKETALNAKIKEYESSDKIKKHYVDMIGDLTYDYRDVVESNKKKIDKTEKSVKSFRLDEITRRMLSNSCCSEVVQLNVNDYAFKSLEERDFAWLSVKTMRSIEKAINDEQ